MHLPFLSRYFGARRSRTPVAPAPTGSFGGPAFAAVCVALALCVAIGLLAASLR